MTGKLRAVVRAWRSDQRGQSLIELGITTPVLVFALIAGVDLLRVGAVQQAVINGARVGAEYAGGNVSGDPDVLLSRIYNEIKSTPGMNAGASSLAQCSGNPPYLTACAVIPIPSGGKFPGTTFSGSPCAGSTGTGSTSSNVCYVKVEVRFTFKTLIAWPWVPNQVTLDRTAYFPVLQQ